ncbi:sensor histidine kinase [Paenibacillus sp. YIM B09110]|uniref:sensor histidine kinase n=1 Tax=Paenibacillus sp. YIM B09110 TaxID=3126102 RepID=UPI00301DC09D
MSILKNPNIFLRILFLFLIVILPIYILVFTINHTSGSILRNEIASSMESRVSSYSELIDSEINHIAQLKTDYLADEDLQKLSTVSIALTQYERLAAIKRLSNKLFMFKESSRFIEDVQIYIPNIQKTIRASSYSKPMEEDEMKMIRETNVNRSPRIVVWREQLILALYDPPYSGARSNFYIKIILSPERMKQTLVQITAKEDGKYFLIDNSNTWMLSNTSSGVELAADFQDALDGNTFLHGSGINNMPLDAQSYLGAYRSSKYLDTTLLVAVPERQIFKVLNRFTYLFWFLSIAAIFVVLFFSYRMYLIIHRPLQVFVRALRRVEDGDLNVALRHDKHDEFQYLYRQFNVMVNRLRELIHEVYTQRILTQQAELKQLQSQINPHFLYNTIFMLHRMAASYGLPDVTRFTDLLGKYFLFLTRTGVSEIYLDEEWNHANVYIEIQKIRFADRIRIEWPSLPEPYRKIKVPRMIIQPLIENAYKYGLEKRGSNAVLQVDIVITKQDSLLISVEDNGSELSDTTLNHLRGLLVKGKNEQEITGLINVHRRLQIYFGLQFGLQVERSELGGLKVTIDIPNRRDDESESTINRG